MARREGAGMQEVTVFLSELAFEALTAGEGDAAAPARMESALRFYLGDRKAERPAWPYPGFLRGSESKKDVPVELEISEELWRDFSEEAATQGVSIEQLGEHSAFYFAAEVDAGRVTQRILDDLEATEGGSETD